MFEQEMQFFKNNQEKFFSDYPGKVLVIKGNALIDVFENFLTAYSITSQKYEPGTFMLQLSAPGKAAYTVTISSIAYV